MNSEAKKLIKHYESLHDGDLKQIGLQPKMCPVGIWTEGYGHAIINPSTNKFLKGVENKQLAYKLSTIKTEKDADIALEKGYPKYEKLVRAMIEDRYEVKLTDYQLGALTSFCYNCGTHYESKGLMFAYKLWSNVGLWIEKKISDSELKKYWENLAITANGKPLKGLVCRRISESELFFSGKFVIYNY